MVHSACLVTPGSEEYGESSQGFLRELGRPCRFHRARRLEIPPTNSRLIHGSASGAGGDEQRTQRWYRQAKETKRGEMGGRESQRLIVPSSQGNHPEGTLGREGDALGTVGGKHDRYTETCHRVHETTTDRGTRQER